ncbi:double-strand break repair helicase AddA [Kordiimonas sp. SCSIO 12610]|uniref:double-strand break repair helicase AddA n=1 Tax=Kordiimonas sp. SCSIO 12610 TaxID=2829597 RepID=UPI00210BEF3E|nr:double-strand break repair helicase AddA [Kordiimonas sp. SCSIO 12610]UTW55222.1 double-strand break repair helicase AddA [Kordiimonas sp. SCSIO 12610]
MMKTTVVMMAGKPSMTPDQALATTPNLTAWVGASAGTGKTHVLTARVLRLMLTGTRPENILCLTFTKAGAAEMKTRIFEELGRWTGMSDDELADEIKRRTEEVADEFMLIRARQLFAEVLELTGGLSIQTFHSFCQSLLGRFPLEAQLMPGFEGIEESAAREIMQEARDKMLSLTREPAGLDYRKALEIVAGLVTEGTFDEVMSRLEFEAVTLNRLQHIFGNVDVIFAALYRALGLNVGETTSTIKRGAVTDDMLDRNGLQALALGMLGGSANDAKKGQIVTDFLASDVASRAEKFDEYTQVFLTKTDNKPRKTVATKKILTANDALNDVIVKEQNRLHRILERIQRCSMAEATAALLRLGFMQLDYYNGIKRERGLVDFDDMIRDTVGLLDQASIAPWILFKLDSSIDHILIDEAQDTNENQWKVVEAIASEFFAGEGAHDKERTVFAVGDTKQSIFSFQRADPSEFLKAKNRIFAQAHNADAPAGDVPLDLSFRSTEAVLSLVDATFDQNSAPYHGLIMGGDPVRHNFIRAGEAGLVELWPLERPQLQVEEEEWIPPVRQETIDDAEGRCARKIAARIHKMLNDGEVLEAKDRPIKASDILVLVRRRTPFVDYLVKSLKHYNVPVAGRDRMVLTDELPVMDLLALGHFALAPNDDLTLATVLKSPFIGLGEDELFDLAYGRDASLWKALNKHAANTAHKYYSIYQTALKYLDRILSAADLMTPFEFYSLVLNELGGRKAMIGRLGLDIQDAVDEFIDQALKYEEGNAPSLQAFLRTIEEGHTQIKRDMESETDSVRIMTVHSSKGLQAPIVFLSDIVATPDTVKDSRILPFKATEGVPAEFLLWTTPGKTLDMVSEMKSNLKKKTFAEYHRLLYVALTRAEDRLYIAGWQGPREPEDESWFKSIENGFGLIGAVEVEGMFGEPVKRFSSGVPSELKTITAETISEEIQTTFQDPPPWLYEEMPAEPTPPRPLVPSKPDEDEETYSPLMGAEDARFERGRIIHSLLEWLPEVVPEAREASAYLFLSRHYPDLNEKNRNIYWLEVEAILNHPDLGALFGPESRAEVSVAGLVGARVVSGQVDRLVVTDDDVMIVDYKTNRPPPKHISMVSGGYLRQMGLYSKALKIIYPEKRVRTALLWTNEARLMELPDELIMQSIAHLD